MKHDPESMSILITKDRKLVNKIKISIQNQLKDLPRNKIVRKSLNNYGIIIYAKNDKKIISICSYIGPEHVEILSKNYKKYLNCNLVAGSVCLGPYSSMAL